MSKPYAAILLLFCSLQYLWVQEIDREDIFPVEVSIGQSRSSIPDVFVKIESSSVDYYLFYPDNSSLFSSVGISMKDDKVSRIGYDGTISYNYNPLMGYDKQQKFIDDIIDALSGMYGGYVFLASDDLHTLFIGENRIKVKGNFRLFWAIDSNTLLMFSYTDPIAIVDIRYESLFPLDVPFIISISEKKNFDFLFKKDSEKEKIEFLLLRWTP